MSFRWPRARLDSHRLREGCNSFVDLLAVLKETVAFYERTRAHAWCCVYSRVPACTVKRSHRCLFLCLSCFCQHAVRRELQHLGRNPCRKLDEARYEDRGADWYVYLRRARRCQFSLQPTDGPRKPHCEDTFGMILRTRPNRPHQRRSLQMGGGSCANWKGSSWRQISAVPTSALQPVSQLEPLHAPPGLEPKLGFQVPWPPAVPPSPLLSPSVPSRTTMRPPVKVPPPHVVKSAETSPVGTCDSAAGAKQTETSYAKPHGSDHQVNVPPLHVRWWGPFDLLCPSCRHRAG